ncbi:MAG: hypothetical protein N2560_07155 [Ignavibacteria bacterium]|nr:hypothetical protein [Ignavibacteria bacterium]
MDFVETFKESRVNTTEPLLELYLKNGFDTLQKMVSATRVEYFFTLHKRY